MPVLLCGCDFCIILTLKMYQCIMGLLSFMMLIELLNAVVLVTGTDDNI